MFITEFGYIDKNGFGSSRSHTAWGDVGCVGPAKLRWKMISDSSFDKFGRMDLLSKCALTAVELLALGSLPHEGTFFDMGIALGTEYGSFETDINFVRSIDMPGGGSPILFPYTLPSTAIGEVAIRNRITGPNVCFMVGAESGLLALWEGLSLVKNREANSCICISCEGISCTSELLGVRHSGIDAASACYAYAFLVEDEGAASARALLPLAKIDIESRAMSCDDVCLSSFCGQFGELNKFLANPTSSNKMLRIAAPSVLRTDAVLVVDRSKYCVAG